MEGLSQCGHFVDKGGGGGGNFSRFCADVFYGRPLAFERIVWYFLSFGTFSIFWFKMEVSLQHCHKLYWQLKYCM